MRPILIPLSLLLFFALPRANWAQNAPQEIHIDQECRVLPDPALRVPGKKVHGKHYANLCHLEGVHDPDHATVEIRDEHKDKEWAQVREQEYVLLNVTTAPVVYVIEHEVPHDWRVDSDPQPESFDGTTAIFRVPAKPGQEVRLHVSMRQEAKPRGKKASATTQLVDAD